MLFSLTGVSVFFFNVLYTLLKINHTFDSLCNLHTCNNSTGHFKLSEFHFVIFREFSILKVNSKNSDNVSDSVYFKIQNIEIS